MIQVEFRERNGQICGFCLSGHAGAGDAGEDIVCAAVSSAAYMAVNTVSEILHVEVSALVEDGLMEVAVHPADAAVCQTVFDGFHLHMQALQQQYPQRVHLKNKTEV